MTILYDLIIGELHKVPGKKSIGVNRSFILCPFHQEKTPSGRIHHIDGSPGLGNFKCYGCGVKKRWNDLASVLNLRQYGKEAQRLDSMQVPRSDFTSLDAELISRTSSREKLELYPLVAGDKNAVTAGLVAGKWRGFKLDFLRSLGASLARVTTTSKSGDTYARFYVYLPVDVLNKTRGYVKAQIRKPSSKEVPSYINAKGSWSLRYGLLFYDQAAKLMKSLGKETLVLVEGPRDALRLLRFGIPAISILGTHSWSSEKVRFLTLTGASRVVLMLDGDPAGRQATRLLRTGRNKEGTQVATPLQEKFQVKIVRLWLLDVEDSPEAKYDPGNCPTDVLHAVKRLLK